MGTVSKILAFWSGFTFVLCWRAINDKRAGLAAFWAGCAVALAAFSGVVGD